MHEDLLKQIQQTTDDLVAKSKENLKQEITKAQSFQKGYEEGCMKLGKQIQAIIEDSEK